MPDEALSRAASGEGRLRAGPPPPRWPGCSTTPGPASFVENFAGQWLQLRRLGGVTPDKDLFPSFDDRLRDSMRRETEHYFASILREDRSILELLDSDYTYLDETLARHYGDRGRRRGTRSAALRPGRPASRWGS